jgi:NarL family two-component system sensor histidine kinase YdfH
MPEAYPLPIFLFLALLSSGVLIWRLADPGFGVTLPVRIGLPFLLGLHLWLHWQTGRWRASEGRWLAYLLIQSSLFALLILLSREPSLGVTLLLWLLGESIGFVDQPRALVYSLLIYAGAGISGLFWVMDRAEALNWLGAALPTAIFILITVALYKQQVQAREEAQALVAELAAANQRISNYAQQVESLTLSHERQRMARELHDTLAQGVAGMIMQLEAVNAHLDAGRYPRAQGIVQEIMARARTTLADARAAISDLRSQEPPLVLTQWLAIQCEAIQRSHGLACTWQIEGDLPLPALPPLHRESVERILSEALANASRHAQASQIRVTLRQEAHALHIIVADDGQGFDPAQIPAQGHYGLRGIRERAALLNGDFALRTAPGQGTTLTVTLPIEGGAAA